MPISTSDIYGILPHQHDIKAEIMRYIKYDLPKHVFLFLMWRMGFHIIMIFWMRRHLVVSPDKCYVFLNAPIFYMIAWEFLRLVKNTWTHLNPKVKKTKDKTAFLNHNGIWSCTNPCLLQHCFESACACTTWSRR